MAGFQYALAVGGLILLLALNHSAVAAPYQAIYAFGDSYSDTGARFLDSDGPTAVAYLAERMGIDMTYYKGPGSIGPGSIGPGWIGPGCIGPGCIGKSINFAASGAISGKETGVTLKGRYWCCQGMMDQVEAFARQVRNGSISFEPQTTLFFIAGGLNDSRLSTEITLRNLTQQISLLKEVGAYHVTLALLPTRIPQFSAVGERLNPAYRRMVPDLRQRLAIDLQLNHWGWYFDEILERPFDYGILNTTSRCAGRAIFDEDPTPCASPETYYYYHESHPSTAVSRVVADKLYSELVLNAMQGATGQQR